MLGIMQRYGLHGKMRWLVAQKDRVRNGELYRMVADGRGAFVQPALYEALGLTVVEAMVCGVPTFATCKASKLSVSPAIAAQQRRPSPPPDTSLLSSSFRPSLATFLPCCCISCPLITF